MMTFANIAAEAEHTGLDLFIPPLGEVILSLICIAALAWLFAKKVIPKYQGILDERAEKIEGGLKKAEEAAEEVEAAQTRLEREIAEARAEAAQIREQAQADGRAIVDEARASAKQEAAKVGEAATKQIDAERRSAMTELKSDVGTLATELAERIIGESLKDSTVAERVIDRFLEEIETDSRPVTKES